MRDVIESAESLMREGGWDSGHIVSRLVSAMKAERAEVNRLKEIEWMYEDLQ